MRLLFLIYLVLTFAGPLYILFSGQIDFQADWRTANRESAHTAPDPNQTTEAIIQVYAARTFNWRGMFAVHTWMAVKPENASYYLVYQSIGWRSFMGLPPVTDSPDTPDRYWFNVKPSTLITIKGKQAAELIPKIQEAVKHYPYRNDYHYWPGPNSNTFIAYIGRQVPGLALLMPANAVGKDFLVSSYFFARTPSGTGYQFSLLGLLGITLAWQEGFEINILGLCYGISPVKKTLKLPGFGDIPLF